MKCPVCERYLQEINIKDIIVDVCMNGCGGIWFDNRELKKVDEQHETAGEFLLDIKKDPKIIIDKSKAKFCPKCLEQKMVTHFVSIKREIEVDECYNCGGIWLDFGELGEIRQQYSTEEERKKATEEFIKNTIEPELDKMLAESEEKLQKARKIAKIFRFICPSYYIPGKQKWGAF